MKINKLATVALAVAGLASYSGASLAANAGGKATFDKTCSECHETGDFEGESAADIGAKIKKIVGGQTKHKKALKLTDQEVSDVAAFFASGGK